MRDLTAQQKRLLEYAITCLLVNWDDDNELDLGMMNEEVISMARELGLFYEGPEE